MTCNYPIRNRKSAALHLIQITDERHFKMSVVASNITKSYGTNLVLSNFSHIFPDNKVTAVIGQSGCGKSTLLSVLMGILPPDSGIVKCSEPISDVFQENWLCKNLTASANLRLVTGKSKSKAEIAKELSEIGLDGCENKTVRELSGGMMRRVALLRALMAEYKVLFLDEPFKGLDLDTKKLVMNYCKEKIKGKTVIFVTHDSSECELLADETVELHPIK